MNRKIVKILKNGGIGVLSTDTIYGLVGLALSKKVVARIYKLRKRNSKKPLIILISSLKDLDIFGIYPDTGTKNLLKKFWPGKVSVILPCPSKRFFYLHRGTKTLAFRLPAKKSLRELLKNTGPLVAPSANPEGLPPAKTILEARHYFKNKPDFYIDNGKLDSPPSALISIVDGKFKILRKGAVPIKNKKR